MLRPAFSTVACPAWTLDRVARSAEEWGYLGVELRSFGEGGSTFACDPALTAPGKVRDLFRESGVEIAGVASGVRFDAPIFPPVLGWLLPEREASINEGKHMVQVASDIDARSLRVFAFEGPPGESRSSLLRRVCDRLARVCDFARNRDVSVLIENGGSFPRAADLVEIVRRISLPQLAAAYDPATAHAAGECPCEGAAALGRWLRVLRIRDTRKGRPCRLGEGDVPLRDIVAAARDADEQWGTDPWAVVTWDRAWLPELSRAEEVLPQALGTLTEWIGPLSPRYRAPAFQSAAPAARA